MRIGNKVGRRKKQKQSNICDRKGRKKNTNRMMTHREKLVRTKHYHR